MSLTSRNPDREAVSLDESFDDFGVQEFTGKELRTKVQRVSGAYGSLEIRLCDHTRVIS